MANGKRASWDDRSLVDCDRINLQPLQRHQNLMGAVCDDRPDLHFVIDEGGVLELKVFVMAESSVHEMIC